MIIALVNIKYTQLRTHNRKSQTTTANRNTQQQKQKAWHDVYQKKVGAVCWQGSFADWTDTPFAHALLWQPLHFSHDPSYYACDRLASVVAFQYIRTSVLSTLPNEFRETLAVKGGSGGWVTLRRAAKDRQRGWRGHCVYPHDPV